jgi:hypothetical protein
VPPNLPSDVSLSPPQSYSQPSNPKMLPSSPNPLSQTILHHHFRFRSTIFHCFIPHQHLRFITTKSS